MTALIQPDPDGGGPQEAPLTLFAYDANGNLTQMTLPDGSTRQWTYDASDHLIGYTDELGHQTLYQVDADSGDVLSSRQVVGQVDSTENGQTDDCLTSYTYTQPSANPDAPPSGLIQTEADPLGHVTRYDYNARGLVTQITYAVGTDQQASIHYEYDSAWRVSAKIDELGRRIEFTYDSAGERDSGRPGRPHRP